MLRSKFESTARESSADKINKFSLSRPKRVLHEYSNQNCNYLKKTKPKIRSNIIHHPTCVSSIRCHARFHSIHPRTSYDQRPFELIPEVQRDFQIQGSRACLRRDPRERGCIMYGIGNRCQKIRIGASTTRGKMALIA